MTMKANASTNVY